MTQMMKIGILGSGNMGRSLGYRWAELGHAVHFGARDPAKARAAADFVGHGSVGGTLEEAALFGDVLLHTARDALLSTMVGDVDRLAGKTVIELNNRPIPPGFAFEPITESYTERLQADAPRVRVVKAFNLFAQEVLEHSAETISAHDVSVFMAGDDADAKSITARLASELGFTPVDGGPLRNARLIETMGDFIRFLIGGQKMGPFATLSSRILPRTDNNRLGGRQPSQFT